MPEFMLGLELCRLFYAETVRPILAARFPGLAYSAARIGSGSDVLGFDTAMSMDHDWGPRLLIFLGADDLERHGAAIDTALSSELPSHFRGFPTGYAPNDDGTLTLADSEAGRVNHQVQLLTVSTFIAAYLGFDLSQEMTPADWLTFPEQKLRTIVEGAVYHDGISLQAARDRFAWYPHDVWLYLLAAGWNRIGQEEHLMGRAGSVGDELGSALIGSRLVRDIMRLCFLMERQYAPYAKWFGTAFQRLACGPTLGPILMNALRAETWRERERYLVSAYESIARMHNGLGITEPLRDTAGSFFNRPFQVIHLAADFAGAISIQIQDAKVAEIASRRLIGNIDLISDNTDLVSSTEWRGTLRELYK